MLIRLRTSISWTWDSDARSLPNSITLPVSGKSKPIISLSSTDLPEPLRPIMTVVSPGTMARFSPRSTLIITKSNGDIDQLDHRLIRVQRPPLGVGQQQVLALLARRYRHELGALWRATGQPSNPAEPPDRSRSASLCRTWTDSSIDGTLHGAGTQPERLHETPDHSRYRGR